MRLFDLTGSVAIVTGGNGGIGLGMAKGLAETGADIVVAARNRDKSERACEAFKRSGEKPNSSNLMLRAKPPATP